MKFVDQTKITVMSGKGAAGAVSFRREKYTPKGGPDGGDGGDGGSVIFKASRKLQTLMDIRMKQQYKAKDGMIGKGQKCHGSNGDSLTIELPLGTQLYEPETGELICDLCEDGMSFIAVKGGKGGLGNSHFATSVNQAPRYAQPGLPSESRELRLELKLLADVGLIGMPNAGKSTLLTTLTNATPKIGNYPFTTLYPNLGVLKFVDREIVVADIPGLIEGASKGVGLGHEFLRHVSRTKLLIHMISLEFETPKECFDAYSVILGELQNSMPDLLSKQIVTVMNKVDLRQDEDCKDIQDYFSERGIDVMFISAAARIGISDLIKTIQKEVDKNE